MTRRPLVGLRVSTAFLSLGPETVPLEGERFGKDMKLLTLTPRSGEDEGEHKFGKMRSWA